VLKGCPLLTASTLTHRPFPLSDKDYHGEGEGPAVWPVPRLIVLRHHQAAYFLLNWVGSGGFPTVTPLIASTTFTLVFTCSVSSVP
jgi:hypothetical protein